MLHGGRCSCQLLSLAATREPGTCGFDYCRIVLQHRWIMHCNHGQPFLLEEPPIYDPVVIQQYAVMKLLHKP